MTRRSSPEGEKKQDHIQRPELERIHASLTMSSACTLLCHFVLLLGWGEGVEMVNLEKEVEIRIRKVFHAVLS